MKKTIEFLFDFGSPNAYLVHKVLPGIAARHGAVVEYVPIFLGAVLKSGSGAAAGQTAVAETKNKLAYQARELARFAARHAVPFAMSVHSQVNTVGAMRGAVFAKGKDWEATYIDTVFRAIWVDGKKMDEPASAGAVMSAAGLPAADIIAATQNPDCKQDLIDNTSQAVQSGVFGVPTMFIGDEMFYGKESLADIEDELRR